MLLLFHYIKSVKLCISKIGGITEIVWLFTSRQLGPHKSATGIDFSFIFFFSFNRVSTYNFFLCIALPNSNGSFSLSVAIITLVSRALFPIQKSTVSMHTICALPFFPLSLPCKRITSMIYHHLHQQQHTNSIGIVSSAWQRITLNIITRICN